MYKLCITDPISGMQWEISYSEYFPIDEDVAIERGATTWIGSYKDSVVAMNDAGPLWVSHTLKSPVTAVFDMFRDTQKSRVVLSRQRSWADVLRSRSVAHADQSPIAHIGQYQGNLYVLSRKNYPFYKDYELAEVYTSPTLGIDGDEGENTTDLMDDCRAGSPTFPACILGTHHLGDPYPGDFQKPLVPLLDGKPYVPPVIPEKPVEQLIRDLPFAPRPPTSRTTTVVGWLVIVLGVLTAVVYSKGIDYVTKPVDTFLAEHQVGIRVNGLAKAVSQRAVAVTTAIGVGRSRGDLKDSLPEFNDNSALYAPRGDMESNISGVQGKPQPEMSEKGRRGPKPQKDQELGEESKDANTSGAGVGGANGGGEKTGRKKKRGNGGKGQKAAAAAAAAAAATDGESPKSDSSKSETGAKDSTAPNSFSSAAGNTEAEAKATDSGESIPNSSSSSSATAIATANTPLLKSINVSDSILGYGSHGTVVYKGTYDGRSVAVKRLLIDFYDVAFHEVRLLQESDDHPNVVRYFRSVIIVIQIHIVHQVFVMVEMVNLLLYHTYRNNAIDFCILHWSCALLRWMTSLSVGMCSDTANSLPL